MRRFLYYIAAAAVVSLAACSSDDPEATPSQDVLELGAAGQMVSVAADMAEYSVPVTANCRWTATLQGAWEGMALATTTGDGDGSVRIVTGRNLTTYERGTATLTVTTAGGIIVHTVGIRQEGAAVSLQVAAPQSNMAAEGDAIELPVTCNTSWRVAGASEGFTVTPVEGSGNGTVRIVAAENMYETPRTLTVSITPQDMASLAKEITVTQVGKVIQLSATPLSITAQAAGGQYQAGITCNAAWTASVSDGWITLGSEAARGEGNGAIAFECEPNTELQPRQATLTVRAGSNNAVTVTVVQQAGTLPTVSTPKLEQVDKYTATFTFVCQSATSDIQSCRVECTPVEGGAVVSQEIDAQAGDVTVTVSGLESGTDYYAVAYATNASGETASEQTAFTTLGTQPGDHDNPLPNMSRRR